MKHIYFMISRTPTKFGSLIRKLGNVKYNHASVSMDEELRELYAFARIQHNALLLSKLMPETIERFTLRRYKNINITLFKIPVTDAQYDNVRATINTIRHDPHFRYNYRSVLSYPLLRGVSTRKAYTCIEFVMHLLSDSLGIKTAKPLCRYTPDDLLTLLSGYICYEGDLLAYCRSVRGDNTADTEAGLTLPTHEKQGYFAPFNFRLFCKSVRTVGLIAMSFFNFWTIS